MLDVTNTFLKTHERFNNNKVKSVSVYCQDGREWTNVDNLIRQTPVSSISKDFIFTQMRFTCEQPQPPIPEICATPLFAFDYDT